MIYIKQRALLKPYESFVLTDFDRTLTTYDSTVSWGLLEESPLIDPNYRKESITLYNQYRPMEIDQIIPLSQKEKLMEKWWTDTANLLQKYHVYEKTIDEIIASSNGLKLRRDSLSFLKTMNQLGVPVVIVSAGIGDFIIKYLQKLDSYYDNITIHSNFFIYEDGKIVGLKKPLIHALNKGHLSYPELAGRKTGLLFGDQIEDIQMGKELHTVNVGFCDLDHHHIDDFIQNFDVILTDHSSFSDVGKIYMKRYSHGTGREE